MSKVIRFTETILRDAQQSQIATRMSTEDMLPILKTLDEAGFYALEMWGGATFDACLRFLNEDPWERLRKIRAEVKHTKLQMLLRGQNLLGYKNYADNKKKKFVQAKNNSYVKGLGSVNMFLTKWICYLLNVSIKVGMVLLVLFYVIMLFLAFGTFAYIGNMVKK